MFSQKRIFIIALLIFTFLLSACGGLPAFGNSNADPEIPLGPQITLTEHQVNVFENILTRIQENYVYYESRQTDLDKLRENYLNEINKGLTSFEFNNLMAQFENEFGTDEIIYITREERITAEISIQTVQFVGIGAFVSYQAEEIPHVVILDVMPDSPAEKAGLRAHDSIYAVDDEPVVLEEGADVVLRIRGEAGTPVVLSVQSPGEEKRDVEIIRASVNGIGEVKINQINDFGYILLPPSVSEDVIDELVLTLSTFSETNTKGIILDLRIANGEANWPLEEMVTLFLNGELGDAYTLNESEAIAVEGQDFFGSQTIPLVVLVGENTFGAPEIFAAFVQSSGRGIVIGSKTDGNIESAIGYPLQNGGQIFIANTSIRTKGNENIGLSGFSPNVEIEAKWDEIILDQDPVIEGAIQSFEVQK